jgi:hypothetical protein
LAEDLNLQDVWSWFRDDFKTFYYPEWDLWMATGVEGFKPILSDKRLIIKD